MRVTSLHDSTGLAALSRRHRVDPQHVRKLARLILQRGHAWEEACTELAEFLPGALLAELDQGVLTPIEQRDSDDGGATKLLLRSALGAKFEAVLLRAQSGRTSLCLSIQAGCNAGCKFCATGAAGLHARLSLEDVLEQVVIGRRLATQEGRLLRNLIFMGMGEPLFELELLFAALERLLDPLAFAFAARRVCVSTVGVPAGMVRLARRFPLVRQALSLHSAAPEERARLIPPSAKHGPEELREAVREVGRLTGGRVFVEYLLLAGRTDRPADEVALAQWLDGLPVHLNLIPYNPLVTGSELTPTSQPEREAFAARMKARGVPTTLRHSLGSDIAAACGQLA